MSLTLAEVKFLLGHAMGYDNRKMPGDANLAAWVEASRRASWTLPAALEALHEHYAHSAEFLMPGHITERIRANRRQPPPVREVLRQLLAGAERIGRAIPAASPTALPAGQLPPGRWSSRRPRRQPLDPEQRAKARAELDQLRAQQPSDDHAADAS